MKSGVDYMTLLAFQVRLERLEHLAAGDVDAHREARTVGARTKEKLDRGANLTREEVAAHLGVSTKKHQRMEAAGTIQRCPNLGTVVRYAARDVLRLAVESRQRT